MSTKLVAALVVILTLLIGVFLGLLGGRFFSFHGPVLRGAPGRMMDEDFIVRRLEREIDPTEAQRDTVRRILEAHAGRLLALHKQQYEEASQLLDSLVLQLDGVLTTEQLEHFRKHLQERRPPHERPGPEPHRP